MAEAAGEEAGGRIEQSSATAPGASSPPVAGAQNVQSAAPTEEARFNNLSQREHEFYTYIDGPGGARQMWHLTFKVKNKVAGRPCKYLALNLEEGRIVPVEEVFREFGREVFSFFEDHRGDR